MGNILDQVDDGREFELGCYPKPASGMIHFDTQQKNVVLHSLNGSSMLMVKGTNRLRVSSVKPVLCLETGLGI